MTKNEELAAAFEALDERIGALETQLQSGESMALEPTLAEGEAIIAALMTAFGHHRGKAVPVSDDLLAIFKAFVKGDPSLNAIRDNVRELVYYRNCINMDRCDALPNAPERMVVRTARHIYLYLHGRAEQEGRLS